MCGDNSYFLRAVIAISPFLLTEPNFLGRLCWSGCFSSAAIPTKLKTKRLRTLQILGRSAAPLRFGFVGRALSPQPGERQFLSGRIASRAPGSSLYLWKTALHGLQRVTGTLGERENFCRTCSRRLLGAFKKITMSSRYTKTYCKLELASMTTVAW